MYSNLFFYWLRKKLWEIMGNFKQARYDAQLNFP